MQSIKAIRLSVTLLLIGLAAQANAQITFFHNRVDATAQTGVVGYFVNLP